MNVQQLIDKFNEVKDKSKIVIIDENTLDDHYVEDSKHVCIIP
jgi:hypothetical protein